MKKNTLFTLILLISFATQLLFCQTSEPPSNFNEENAGTEENPYLISNLENLRWLSGSLNVFSNPNFHYLQTNDIDAISTKEWKYGFWGIGYYDEWSEERPFRGHYDGGNFKIKNIHAFNQPDFPLLGESVIYNSLFGVTNGATIKNVNLENFTIISARPLIGVLINSAKNTSVINCSIVGTITLIANMDFPHFRYGGSLITGASNSYIENCYSSATVIINEPTNDSIAGLIFGLHNSTLINSYFNGKIIAEPISTDHYALIYSTTNSFIQNCYVASKSDFDNVISFVNRLETTTISNNVWDFEVSGITLLYNELIGDDNIIENNLSLSSAEMKRVKIYEESGWDFETVWAINPNFNDGYPFLRSHHPEIEHVTEKDNVIKPINQTWVYPNPVLGSEVNIKSTSRNNSLEVTIYNIRGQLINRSNEFFTKDGESVFTWNKRDMNNNEVTSGVYFYKIVDPNDKNSVHHGRFLILK